MWGKPYKSLGIHVSEKDGDAAEGDGKGALPGAVV
jgi:hypothetical protein